MSKLVSMTGACLIAAALFQPVLFGQEKKGHAKKKPSVPNKPFEPGCALPFATIAVPHPIDKICPRPGNADPGPHADQNTAKNNFCAPEAVTDITRQDLLDLQKAAADQKILFGSEADLPPDRSVLGSLQVGGKKLGEGMRVRMKAFIIEAHHADVTSGESVNCNQKGSESNDIHIALGDAPTDQECSSVTAEISPHSRPASWDKVGQKHVVADLQKHALRFTGQLFFDAAHHPCPCGTSCSGNPLRASLWEIHPVYAIDVCTGTTCDVANDADWVSLDEWKESGAAPKKK